MRVIKSLLLGAAAGLAATAGVQAADMPVKAKAIEYVKICSAYGAGFYYIPGTDICLRVGGAVRADYYHNAPGAFPDIHSGNTRTEETHGLRGRGYLILDARNNTSYGTLRAYMNIYQSWTTSSAGLGAAEGTNADRAFIQFAGFTFGRAASFFDFFGSSGPQANLVNWGGQTTGATGWNVLAYTAQFGNGLSGTFAMEDSRRKPIFGSTAAVTTSLTAGVAPTSVRAGQNMPAFTANIRVDQAWGSAQLMGAVQELRALEPNNNMDTYGYAVGGGFTWKNPSAPGSEFGIQAAWANGAAGYVQTGSVVTTHGIVDGSPIRASASFGTIADGVIVGTSIDKTTVWGVNAGYQHRFSPQWAASLHGGYTAVSYGGATQAALPTTTLDFDVWSLGSRLLWTPVAGLNFGLDVLYHSFESQALPGGWLGGPGIVTAKTNDVWAAMFRVQRDF